MPRVSVSPSPSPGPSAPWGPALLPSTARPVAVPSAGAALASPTAGPRGGGGRARAGGLLLLLGLALPPALASSPAAWRDYDREVRAACLQASRLRQPRVLGERVDVPVADRTPNGGTLLISALLLEGRWSQPAPRGQTGRELCVFEQRTRRATVADADALAQPRPKP
jgi:hypothetical protein